MTLLKKWLRVLCVTYTVCAMLLLLLNLILNSGVEEKVIYVPAFLRVFVFAAVYALTHLLYTETKLPHGARVALHFAVTVPAAFLLLYLPNNPNASSSGKLILAVVMIAVYWICMGIFLALTAKKRRAAVSGKEYRNVYKK